MVDCEKHTTKRSFRHMICTVQEIDYTLRVSAFRIIMPVRSAPLQGFGSFHRGALGQHRNSNYHSNRPPHERELGKRSRVPLQKMLSLSSLQSFLTLQLLLELAPRHEVSQSLYSTGTSQHVSRSTVNRCSISHLVSFFSLLITGFTLLSSYTPHLILTKI